MKRLLLPLIAELSLPTAVNANWLSGDIVETNAIGEKTIIKKTTIRLEKNTVNGSYERLQKRITKFDSFINRSQEKLKKAQKKYLDCMEEKGSFCDSLGDNIVLWSGSVRRNKSRKKDTAKRLEPTLLKYKNWNGTGNEVISTTIYYTPIFEDINKNKTVLKEQYVECGNLSIDFSSLGITNDNEGLTSLERKICNKYAKF